MELTGIALPVILAIIMIGLLLYIKCYHRNLRRITRQLKDIAGRDTNQIVTSSCQQKDFVAMVNQINELLKKSRSVTIQTMRLSKRFRQSVTNISHDLRTPLTTAGGYVQMLREEELSRKEQDKYLQIIEERQNAVKKLLEQLFEYVRMETGEITYQLERVDVNRILKEVIALYYEDYMKKNQEPEIILGSHKCIIMGDSNGLHRLFSNIIWNSLIHGSGNYKIVMKEKPEYFCYDFSNGSEPLNEDELESIFERFYIRNQIKKKPTTGLGLSIAQQITVKMGGNIRAKFQEGLLHIIVQLPKTRK